MESIDALQAIERGQKVDQATLRSLGLAQLINLSSVSHVGSSGTELVFAGFTPQGLRLLKESKSSLASELERQILNVVVRGFLDRHEPTSTRTLLQQLKCSIANHLRRLSDRGALNVVNNTYLNETYLPKAIAFYHCGDSAALAFARRSTEVVLRVLPILFDRELEGAQGSDQKQFTAEDVLKEAQTIDSSIDLKAIFTGLYLAQDFSVFSMMRKDDKQVGIISFSLGERVYEKQYLDWDDHIRRSNTALVNEWEYAQRESTPNPKKESVPSENEPTLMPTVDGPLSLFIRDADANSDTHKPVREETMKNLSVLISHSSKDQQLASALIDFLRSGLGLLPRQIRCTSVDGYRLPAGVHTDTQLRDEVKSSKVLVGLITANSLASPYVMFELGARWGAGAVMIPLLAGVTADQLRGPLSGMNALMCSSEEQLHQALEEIGGYLGLEVQSAAAYLKQLRSVMQQVPDLTAPTTRMGAQTKAQSKKQIPPTE